MVATRRKRNAPEKGLAEARAAPSETEARGAAGRKTTGARANLRGSRPAKNSESSDHPGQENVPAICNADEPPSARRQQTAGAQRKKVDCVQLQVLGNQVRRSGRRQVLDLKSQEPSDSSPHSEARLKEREHDSPTTPLDVHGADDDVRRTELEAGPTKLDAFPARPGDSGGTSEKSVSPVVRVMTYGKRKRARTARASIALLGRRKSSSPESVHGQNEDREAEYATHSGEEAEAPERSAAPRMEAAEKEMWRRQREFWDDVDNIVLDEEQVEADEMQ